MDREECSREKKICRVTYVGGGVNFLLIIFKFAAGLWGQSSAMVADAVHSFSDFVTDVIVIAFVRISGKPKDVDHDYGHGKFETLATLLIGVVLLFVGLGIAYNGIRTIIEVVRGAVLPSPGTIALVGAVVSIVAKEILFRYTAAQGRRLKSDAVIANAWHHRSDAFSSVATVLGIAGAIVLGDRWTVLDPLAGVAVSFFIGKTALGLIKPSVDELLEKSLPQSTEDEIVRFVDKVEGVHDIHDLRTRKIGNYYAIEFSVCMDGKVSLKEAHDVISKIDDDLRRKYGDKTHVMIHVEPLPEQE
ncbi:MAG: cation diffusion facilitator family transporter [Rikenellaceae bacterium]|nr:cation diffusion facilitator family transporter [Rikenellaceae bacterium]